jgi:transposase
VARKEYSFEIRDRCEGLYVNEGKTLHEISGITGVPEVTVQRWSAQDKKEKEDWESKKKRYRERLSKAQEETRALVREEVLLQDLVNQKNLMDKYFEDREYDKADSNTVSNYINIVNNVSKLLQDIRKRDENLRNMQKVDRPPIFLDFMRDLVSFLKDHDPEALTALEKNFDEFISFAKSKYS